MVLSLSFNMEGTVSLKMNVPDMRRSSKSNDEVFMVWRLPSSVISSHSGTRDKVKYVERNMNDVRRKLEDHVNSHEPGLLNCSIK